MHCSKDETNNARRKRKYNRKWKSEIIFLETLQKLYFYSEVKLNCLIVVVDEEAAEQIESEAVGVAADVWATNPERTGDQTKLGVGDTGLDCSVEVL